MFNKSNNKLVYDVAKWEFNRWFKLKEHLITILVGVVISLLIFGGSKLFNEYINKKSKVALINETGVSLVLGNESSIELVKVSAGELEKVKKQLEQEEIDGILIIKNYESVKLIVNKEPSWVAELQPALNIIHQQIEIKGSNISTEELAKIFKNVEVKMEFTELQNEKATQSEKFTAIVFIALMLIGVFAGLAYQFAAITGEKQLRITEVVVSAISPQTWIDGKIIGISLLSIIMVVTYSITSLSFTFVSMLFGSGWSIPVEVANPFLVTILFLITFLGFIFWNTFFSAIAATINDPNTSARGSLIMLPVVPIVFGFSALSSPDTLFMKVLSLFPLTSTPVMSARLVVSTVPVYEIILSIVLLLISIGLVRIAAGRIFEYSILIYGKEPSWKELFKFILKK